MVYTTNTIISNIASNTGTVADHFVFLNFKSRNNVDSDDPWMTNRVALKAESVQFDTSRTVPSFPLPFSGAITGESTTLAIDLGMASKTVTVSGIITDQVITKKDNNGVIHTVEMTAQEVAQLLSASVDSSFLQTQQNIGEVIILMPSRVNNDYNYYNEQAGGNISDVKDKDESSNPNTFVVSDVTGFLVGDILYDQNNKFLGNISNINSTRITVDKNITDTDITKIYRAIVNGNTDIADCPLIPFTWTSRDLDEEFSRPSKHWPSPITNTSEVTGLKGFIRQFGCTFDTNPFVAFNLNFEVAFVPLS